MTAPVAPAVRPLDGGAPVEGDRRRRTRRTGRPVLFAGPALAWYLLFLIGPLVAVFWYSLSDATSLIAPVQIIGVDNYQRMLSDPVFWDAVVVSLVHVAVVVPLLVVLGFMLGYYLFLRPPAAGLLRILFFTSSLLSVSAKAMIFYAILAPNGLVNQFLGTIGLESLETNWIANRTTALPVIMMVDLWSGVGFLAILIAAQLTSVSKEIIEAATMDGCGNWRAMWHIAFGMHQGYIGTIAMLQYLWTLFGSAATVMLLTRGGPGTSTQTLSFLVYTKAFDQYDIGYSQAVGVALIVVGVAGAVLIRTTLRSRT